MKIIFCWKIFVEVENQHNTIQSNTIQEKKKKASSILLCKKKLKSKSKFKRI